MISCDGGALLWREVDRRINLLPRLAACCEDRRHPQLIEPRVGELVSQRVYALPLGYEDLNDHDELRRDPLLVLLAGQSDLEGQKRQPERARGKPLAGQPTLNRRERTTDGGDRYQKIRGDSEAIDRLLGDVFVAAQPPSPDEIMLAIDATDTPFDGPTGRAFLARILGALLLSAAVHFQRPARIGRAAAGVESRRGGGRRGGAGKDRGPDAGSLAGGEDHAARGLGFLSRPADELLRGERGGWRAEAGPQRAAALARRHSREDRDRGPPCPPLSE